MLSLHCAHNCTRLEVRRDLPPIVSPSCQVYYFASNIAVRQNYFSSCVNEHRKDAEEFVAVVIERLSSLPASLSPCDRSDSKTWRWKVQGCSATQGSGLREGMDWLATAVRAKRTRGSSHRRIAKSASRLLVEAPVA